MRKRLWTSLRDERGGDFIEYVIIVGVVALLSIGAFTTFGTDVKTEAQEQVGNVALLGL